MSQTERYICIHGHFYQPPRENPSLEAVEVQDSAYPYHDWNERVTAECYGPNGASRILDSDGRISNIVNNYSRISFNFGPTLLAWLQKSAPDVYSSILQGDLLSQQRFSGHGSALAQPYNHIILPLANPRDKLTQITWGIRDFHHRFHRPPEGIWLPETAVDLETLDILADSGILFTILAQHQARRFRRIGSSSWRDVSGGRIDPTRAYSLPLPSGRSISLFFYDGPISRAVAFEGLLNQGENLASRLASAFSNSRSWPQLVHIATDGESYGHHHHHGDMALAYALQYIDSHHLARLTNYGEFLEKYPPTHEVEIFENSSWSCAHGIERWRSNCGCNSGGYPLWNQEWRGPLREAFDWLRDTIASHFQVAAARLLKDPWLARNDYISVVLDRSPDQVERFLQHHAVRNLDEADKTRVLKLLELQRHAMLMYTSCGWFFDDLSGIETVQTLRCAGRALQLAQDLFGQSLEAPFLERLELAKSNIPEHRDGRHIYEKWVKPALVDLEQVGAHYAISSLFENRGERGKVYCYFVDPEVYRLFSTGKVRLALGRATITSEITRESKKVSFGILHLGDHKLIGGVRESCGEEAYGELVRPIDDAFARGDLTGLVNVVERSFGSNGYSLKMLFRDQQRKILDSILDSTLGDVESVYQQVYEHHAPTMRLVSDLNGSLPGPWRAAAELVINSRLRRALQSEELDGELIGSLLGEAKQWQVALDGLGLGHIMKERLARAMERVRADPTDISLLKRLEEMLDATRSLPFYVDLWKPQNLYFDMLRSLPDVLPKEMRRNSETAGRWMDEFTALGEKLGVHVAVVQKRLRQQAPDVPTLAQEVAADRRIPRATYRLQFNDGFTLADARALLPYLDDLGISDLYSSPLLKARPGSTHGYDVCDHSQINPTLGTEQELADLSKGLKQRGMGLLLDVVPNHMGINDSGNLWWMDVLENGPSSPYASYFDIDWLPVKPELRHKVLIPILEDQYGQVLEQGKLQLSYEDGAFFVQYRRTRLPIDPCSYGLILGHQVATLVQALGETSEQVQELQSILTALNHLPRQTDLEPESIAERCREKEVIKRRLSTLYQSSRYVRAAIDTAVEAFNGEVGNPHSFDLLDELLHAQAYRPAHWRVASEEINYRRFFDVNDLAAIRVELPEVFDATHQSILRWLAEGKVTGLRIDHPDGLRNPRSYFLHLQESFVSHRIRARWKPEQLPDNLESRVSAWFARQSDRGEHATTCPLYIVVEKILCGGEQLREDWWVDGTTGYDFLNAVNALFVDTSHREDFDRIYQGFIGRKIDYLNLVNSTKKMIMLVSLSSEINALSHQLERVAEKNRRYRDFTLNSLTFALREIIAALPVYRTYLSEPGAVGRQDQSYLEAATENAKRRNPHTAASIFDFVRDTLLLRNLQDFQERDRRNLVDTVMKFQQISGPVMAKGVEDTAFYIYNPLVSLNEVGGHPPQFGISTRQFHQLNIERQQRWPHSMLATSTHDGKRGEDVRARIDVLSEIPEEWEAALFRWSRLNAPKKQEVDGKAAPDPNDEYLLYQTLLGAWPEIDTSNQAPVTSNQTQGDAETLGRGDAEDSALSTQHSAPSTQNSEPDMRHPVLPPEELEIFCDRIVAYMHKATKEAKTHTSWINPNHGYDAAVESFVRQLLSGEHDDDPFMKDFLALQHRVAFHGRINGLAQTLLKLTAPGVPDFYQGTELWDLNLVDPDNRRPVDYGKRASLLRELKERVERGTHDLVSLARGLLDFACDGRIKLYLIQRTLGFRREHWQLFLEGSYLPLLAQGAKRDHVCAFARVRGQESVLVVVPRLVVQLTEGACRYPIGSEVWGDTRLPLPPELMNGRATRRYRNLFTGETLSVGKRCSAPNLPIREVLAHFPVALLHSASRS